MTRKRFLLIVLPFLFFSGLTSGWEQKELRDLVDAFPAYEGTRYDDVVPATLDFAEMAELSLAGMTRPLDEARDYTLYFLTVWNRNPAVLRHEEGSDACQAKFTGPLVLNRILCGSEYNLEIEKKVLTRYLADLESEVFNSSGSSTRILEGFIMHYLRDGNPLWKSLVTETVNRWIQSLESTPDGNGCWKVDDKKASSFWAQDPWKDEILLLADRFFHNKEAFETAGKHLRYVRHESGLFDRRGRFFDDHGRHFHIHALYLLTFLDYALQHEDKDIQADWIRFVKRSYEWAKSKDAGSSSLIGFFPEFVHSPQSEGCCIADMVALALKLSKADAGAYWDDADRWIRNHFTEIQLTRAKGIELEAWSRSFDKTETVEPNESDVDVSERCVGAFSGWPGVNEWVHPAKRGIQHCCTGNACRTLFYVWDGIMDYADNALNVNLMLNRASKEADIYSYLPYSGRLVVKVKEPCETVRIRIQDWISRKALQGCVNGLKRPLKWDGSFLTFDKIKQGDLVELTFPVDERTQEERIGDTKYRFVLRGSTVVEVQPKGSICPLYDRGFYRKDTAPTKKVRRFISPESCLLEMAH
ncbi:MAG: hypothetical protein ABIK28_00315 [Planctomycetota bacterium]